MGTTTSVNLEYLFNMIITKRSRRVQSLLITTIALLSISSTLSISQNATCKECIADGPSPVIHSVPTNDRLIPSYGVDISFPMHKAGVSTNYPHLPHNMYTATPTPPEYEDMPVQLLGDRQKVYDHYLEGCRTRYSKISCDASEMQRVEMNVRQPQSMVNFTKIGFKKIRAPKALFELLTDFWQKNKDKKEAEAWHHGNSYVNHWENMSYMVSVENPRMEYGGSTLKQLIWENSENIIQEWTKQKNLKTTSLYGIRVYEEGAILATHVDRLPLVSSAIINVDQDVDEPWPLEVIGHDGKAYNVTMEPGDMVLYESHSVLHGRPFALKGRYFANIFIHFAPEGDIRADDGRPSYILEGSPEATRLRSRGETVADLSTGQGGTDGSSTAHIAGREGDLRALEVISKYDKSSLFRKDVNGWSAMFEAARGGHIEVMKFLMYHGQNIAQENRAGQTAYEIAEEFGQIEIMRFIRNEWYLKQFGKLPRILLRNTYMRS